ncbi:MAG TPA: hypothetical protein VM659_04290 [Dongiaceae bacterium]|nr:hypothetical protein [Dongiaceae bacterium]
MRGVEQQRSGAALMQGGQQQIAEGSSGNAARNETGRRRQIKLGRCRLGKRIRGDYRYSLP